VLFKTQTYDSQIYDDDYEKSASYHDLNNHAYLCIPFRPISMLHVTSTSGCELFCFHLILPAWLPLALDLTFQHRKLPFVAAQTAAPSLMKFNLQILHRHWFL